MNYEGVKMSRLNEINKIIISKIKQADTSQETKEFLIDIFSFERDYFNEDMNRFSAHYKSLAEHHLKHRGARKK